MKFKLLRGSHSHDDGEGYTKGDVVESEHNLVVMFPEKFELIHEEGHSTKKGTAKKGGKKGAAEDDDDAPDVEDETVIDDSTVLVGTKVKDTAVTKKSAPDDLNTRGGTRTSQIRRGSTTKAKAGKSKGAEDEDDDF